jgi:hypothetical protein
MYAASVKSLAWFHIVVYMFLSQVSYLIHILMHVLYSTGSFLKDDRLCGLVVSVADYKHRGPGFDSRALLRIFLWELGLEQGPLSLVIG